MDHIHNIVGTSAIGGHTLESLIVQNRGLGYFVFKLFLKINFLLENLKI
jgi:hypothetical protein